MFKDWQLFFVFIGELFVLYLLSRQTINELFRFLRLYFRTDRFVFSIISTIFFPGTLLHELSHFFMAMILLLRVRSIKVFPEWEGNYIKLGSVVYEKKDFLRSILVGIAPVILGIVIFWWLSILPIFTKQTSFVIQALAVYFIFAISTTMFSSKQDLVDTIYLIPFVIILAIAVFIFKVDLLTVLLQTTRVIANINSFLYAIVIFVSISIGIHIFLLCFLKLWRTVIHKK